MTSAIDQAALALTEARRQRRRTILDARLRPTDEAQAYAIQDAVTARLASVDGAMVRGWKVGASGPGARPTAAPIYTVLASPARIDPNVLHMLAIEAEIAVLCGHDLPPRSRPYETAEVLAALAGLRVAIEVCDTRLDDWQSATDLTKLADNQLNQALVLGAAIAATTHVDFLAQPVVVRVNGRVLRQATGGHAMGDPVTLLPWLANHAARLGGLKRGDAVTTGSWTGMHFVESGDQVMVEFPGLGEARLCFAA